MNVKFILFLFILSIILINIYDYIIDKMIHKIYLHYRIRKLKKFMKKNKGLFCIVGERKDRK